MLMCCFSSSTIYNLPMWSFYADNYEGFCCEYEIIDNNSFKNFYLRKVEYVESCPENDYYSFVCDYAHALDSGKKEHKHLDLCFRYASYKSNKWSNECEYRMFSPKKENKVKLTEANLKMKTIYIGFKMSQKNKKEIIKIGKLLNISVKMVQVSSVPFNLDTQELV